MVARARSRATLPAMTADERRPDFPFLVLTAVFLAALVVCNLIAQKFVTVDLGFFVFTVSAGSLPYPVTFLVTDLLSEVYGRRRANQVVWSGFAASLFVLGVLWLADAFPAIPDSPLDEATFHQVFANNAPRTILASMVAYLCAQLVDVWLYHFWRDLTKGRHLWLRNNFSTVASQLLDSVLVVLVLFWGVRPGDAMLTLILHLWAFKALCALVDTPFLYLGVWLMERWRPAPL